MQNDTEDEKEDKDDKDAGLVEGEDIKIEIDVYENPEENPRTKNETGIFGISPGKNVIIKFSF